ncbi:hypothetical protein CI109_100583 [Kwoniella shandongensis]|uniref:Elongator complex protein 2 n=1 Tax=Kwoniella shandongensis TaxID=1734106 RepID=A0A5M6BZC9_9TREE|nr:uncharacterized protein CI109_003495 [Kwoniella shandongensis]KAA5528206.1 hypothetical protein CI109_003495 [Kwoniella shandongensis]
MRVEPAYISIGSNRASSSAASTSTGTLAFGAGKFVALWSTQSTSAPYIRATLPGHKGQVTSLKLLSDNRIVSGDAVGEVRVWKSTDGEVSWECEVSWEAHKGASISAIGVVAGKGDGFMGDKIFTGGSDGIVRLWKIGEKVEEIQKIDLKGKLPLDLEVGYLPGSSAPILALGCTDRRIQMYTLRDGLFHHSLSLEGHEDWIRCLSFTSYPSASSSSSNTDLLLASGSQDNFIRLWRVSPVEAEAVVQEDEGKAEGLDLLDEFERKLAGEAGGNVQISTKAHVISVQDGERSLRYNITLEALLVGHESGLTNVHWSPHTPAPILLSSASDNSLIIWAPSETSTSTDGIWVPEHRFGAIGGRGLSFYGAIWGKDGRSVMAGGWNGGWEMWAEEDGVWEVKKGLNGHFGPVQSVTWDHRGEYLLSVASDQTSRIHAECSLPSSSKSTWAEIARPQIHGYDMTDVSFITPLRFVSSADEKVARVFDAPEGFVQSLATLGVTKREDVAEGSSRPKGATVPPLGLSNRALQKAPVAGDAVEKQGQNEAIISISHTLTTLPTEEELATSTLWPEVEKVYGHGYELVCVASSHAGDVIATASKATNAEHAVVRVVSTSNWELVGEPLSGHSLTITRICFSKDDQRILTSSRDRGWRLFGKKDSGGGYEFLAGEEKAHARMVLDCCWAGDSGDMFATASRDKTVKLWRAAVADGSQWSAAATIKLTEAATAIDVISMGEANAAEQLLLAIGTESGTISIHSVSAKSDVVETRPLSTIDQSASHVDDVNRLAWRRNADGKMSLASCSDDRSVRVFDISLDEREA